MERYGPMSQKRGPVPPMRVSSLNSSETRTLSSAGRSSEASSMRSGRSALSFDSGHRTSQESTKPRLSKDQQEFLERQFAHHQKPNTQTKKGFANDLNVPLEKINNWFQNRRAKSKQDAKKKQNAYQHFMPPHPFANGRAPGDQCFIDPSFYHHTQPHPAYLYNWQPVLPGNSCEPHVNTNNAHFGVPLETSDISQAQPLSEQLMMSDDPNPRGFDLFFGFDDYNDPNAVNMYGRQFPGPEPVGGLMDTIPEYDESSPNGHHTSNGSADPSSMRPYRSGAEDDAYSITYPPSNGDLPLPPSADFFHPNEAEPDRYPLRTWGQSAGRPLDSDERQIGLDVGDSQLPYRTVDPSHNVSGVTPASLHHQPAPAHDSSDGPESFGFQSSESMENAAISDDMTSNGASPVSKRDAGFRRDSTMSRLVESIDNVEVQPHVLERKSSQQSIGHPSLASRRQRRPAPLGAPGMRSTSYSSTTPASPKSVQPQTSERELRRVRSSIGVMNGRVQKAGLSASAQRSPLSFTFSDATASSRISKSLSSRSMTSLSVDTLSRTNSLVPITPVSPPDEEPDPNEESNGHKSHNSIHELGFATDDSVWANMPNTSDTNTGSVWSSQVPHNDDSDPFDYASPPETPLQSQQALGAPYDQQNGQFSMMPPHSQPVPSWQQTFTMGPPTQQYAVPMPPAMMSFHPHLLRHHSADQVQVNGARHSRQHSQSNRGNPADFAPSSSASADTVPTAFDANGLSEMRQFHMAQQYQVPQQPQQAQQSQQTRSPQRSQSQSQPQPTSSAPLSSPPRGGPPPAAHQHKLSRSSGQYVFQLGDPDLTSVEPGQAPPAAAQMNSSPNRGSQELLIQQFSPREPVDPSRLPPKTKLNEAPKHFEFQTWGPENFSSP